MFALFPAFYSYKQCCWEQLWALSLHLCAGVSNRYIPRNRTAKSESKGPFSHEVSWHRSDLSIKGRLIWACALPQHWPPPSPRGGTTSSGEYGIPGELLVPLQMHTGSVPGSVNATNKLWGYRVLVSLKRLALNSHHILGREARGEFGDGWWWGGEFLVYCSVTWNTFSHRKVIIRYSGRQHWRINTALVHVLRDSEEEMGFGRLLARESNYCKQ